MAVRFFVVIAAFVAVGVGLIHFGVVRNPFGPTIEGDVSGARRPGPGLRVLFVGNSFTYENDLPSLIRHMLNSDADRSPVYVVAYTRPGGRLRQAANDKRLAELLRDVHWNFVVLQEQSEIPSFPAEERAALMDGYVRDLTRRIRENGAAPVLFETWGYRRGDGRNLRDDSYAAMQARLDRGYEQAATEVNATVAPVGAAWRHAFKLRPGLKLWAGDGKHPSRLGSYLAAAVFYEIFTHHSARSLAVTEGIAVSDAHFLLRIADAWRKSARG